MTYQKTGEPTPDDLGKALFAKLKVVGAAYLAKYGRPPVLVVDGADVLYKKHPEFLTNLQTLAKNAADANALRVVFVMSEKAAFEMLQSHSHASRSEVFVVGDIDDNEAVEFLVSSGVDEKNAQDAVARITGGRFVLLNDYVSAHQRDLTNDQVLVKHITSTERALKKLRIKKTDPLFSNVAAGSLYEKDDQVDVDELSKLARENILAVDLATGLVSFPPGRWPPLATTPTRTDRTHTRAVFPSPRASPRATIARSPRAPTTNHKPFPFAFHA